MSVSRGSEWIVGPCISQLLAAAEVLRHQESRLIDHRTTITAANSHLKVYSWTVWKTWQMLMKLKSHTWVRIGSQIKFFTLEISKKNNLSINFLKKIEVQKNQPRIPYWVARK